MASPLVPHLDITQRQSLTMTQKLRQAIGMLAMNNIELSEMINAEIDNNPLLEREDFSEKVDKDNDDGRTDDDLDIDIDNQFNNGQDDYEYRSMNRRNDFSASDFDMDDLENKTEESLFSHLEKQIDSEIKQHSDKMIAKNLLMQLEPTGYFSSDFSINDFAAQFGVGKEKILSVIKRMQSFTPFGCFTKDLKETLSVQLRLMNKLDPLMMKMLDNLELFVKKDFREMKKQLQATDDDILSLLADIKLCNPKPGTEFGSADNFHIIPDIIVKEGKNGDYRIEINQNTLIKPLINREYIADLRSKSNDKKLNRFISENESSANWLIKSINQRNVNMLKVATEIVNRQKDFFRFGIDYMKPLNLNDISAELGLDESTVSRITSNKYMATPRGIFDLKYFFPSKLASEHSSETVKHRIKQLIDAETADSVLSDDEISVYLKREGINIARRTVLKYRESMGIKSSSVRKREKRLAQKVL